MDGRAMVFVGHQYTRDDVDSGAFMYCSSTGWAFGPLFDTPEDVIEFFAWLDADAGEEVDPRVLSTRELHARHSRWLAATSRVT